MSVFDLDLEETFDLEANTALTESIYTDLKDLEKISGRNDKIARLATITQATKDLIALSLNPFVRFGVSSIYQEVDGKGLDWSRVFNLLNKEQGRALRDLASDMSQKQLEIINGVFDGFMRLKIGVKGGSFLKVYPGYYPTFELQAANLLENEGDLKDGEDYYASTKLDGVRCMAIVRPDGEVIYLSRNGKPILNVLDSVTADLKQYPGMCFDGEVEASSFQNTISTFKKASATERMTFKIFDAITFEELKTKKCTLTYVERQNRLRNLTGLKNLILDHVKVRDYAHLMDLYRDARANGLEGMIAKAASGLYSFKRTDAWLKVKPLTRGDFRITGLKEGKPGSKYEGMLGAFEVVDEMGIKSDVGGGLTDKQRKEFWLDGDDLIGTIVEVEYMERTEIKRDRDGKYLEGGKLRHPRFFTLRLDKDEINTTS